MFIIYDQILNPLAELLSQGFTAIDEVRNTCLNFLQNDAAYRIKYAVFQASIQRHTDGFEGWVTEWQNSSDELTDFFKYIEQFPLKPWYLIKE